MSNKRRLIALAALVLLLLAAFAVRIFRLDGQSLWWDEGISLHLATATLSEIVANRAANTHPPLYFMALKGWVTLVGVTPFAARYSSVLGSLLQVTAVYALTRRWFKQPRIVWVAAGLTAISPLSVVYAQEVRVYAFLPLVYLAALLFTDRLVRPANSSSSNSRQAWIGLALAEWIGLHLHYITIFMAGYISLWALWSFSRQRRWRQIWTWVGVQVAVGMVSLPWAAVVLANWAAAQAEANAGSFLAEPVPLPFMLAQVWVFHLTGLAGALGRPLVVWLAGLAGLGLLVLLFLNWRERRRSLTLAAHWLLPLMLALIVWSLRSFSHPRYVTIYAIMLIPLAAFLMAGSRRPLLTGWLGLPLVLLSFWGLWAYFNDPGVAKDDMRGVAHYLETAASPDDLIIVQDAGWALQFEYHGRTPIITPGTANPTEMWSRLGQATAQANQVFTVMSATDARDWQNVVPFALEQAGSMVAVKRFDGLVVRQYTLRQPVMPPEMEPLAADFGVLHLVAAQVEEAPAANSAVTLALTWEVADTAVPRLYLDLRLLDVDNWPLAHSNSVLLNIPGRPTDQWLPGQTVTTYHVLPVPPGTPPLTYALALSLAAADETGQQQPIDLLDAAGSPQGQQLRLTEDLVLAPPIGSVVNPYQVERVLPRRPETAVVAPGLSLIAAGLDRGQASQGQSLFVSLEWEAGNQPLPDLRPQLALLQSGVVLTAVADAPSLGRYPTTLWSAGERVVEHRRLRIPAEAAAGTAVVAVLLDDVLVEIGTVEIVAEARLFNLPPLAFPVAVQFGQVARLVGYDLPQTQVTTSEAVPLTLYWESLADGEDVSYTVFAHVLAENGRLIGQHDGLPVGGTRPTTGWVVGEYLIDPHPMSFREPDYEGTAVIEVGLYDPATGRRVMTPAGQDHFILPVTLDVNAGQ